MYVEILLLRCRPAAQNSKIETEDFLLRCSVELIYSLLQPLSLLSRVRDAYLTIETTPTTSITQKSATHERCFDERRTDEIKMTQTKNKKLRGTLCSYRIDDRRSSLYGDKWKVIVWIVWISIDSYRVNVAAPNATTPTHPPNNTTRTTVHNTTLFPRAFLS